MAIRLQGCALAYNVGTEASERREVLKSSVRRRLTGQQMQETLAEIAYALGF